MSRIINFAKIQSTGNDFIVIEGNRNLNISDIAKLCDRKFGIGADGFIQVAVKGTDSIEMNYFNADGSQAAVCGNGLRATALFARVAGMIKTDLPFTIFAKDGQHETCIQASNQICVEILVNPEINFIRSSDLKLSENLESLGSVNTGVPHLVIKTKIKVEKLDVYQTGRNLRYNSYFEPEGTNVNFMEILSSGEISVRTYERGVENETLSCGTGVVASVLMYWNIFPDNNEVHARTKGGDLTVTRRNQRFFLTGPSEFVFAGHYLINE